MKILVTGAGGNLGRRLVQDFSRDHEVRGLTHSDLDISNYASVKESVSGFGPDVILNAAAFTAVDRCEDEIDIAYSVNSVGVRNLCSAANALDSRIVHFSTDFVFDGTRNDAPYREYDEVNPLSVYGKSKYRGEVEVRQLSQNYLILRVAWLYGPGGWNFTDWVVEQTTSGKEIQIVTDQFGCPTWVGDVSTQIRHLLEADARGLYHSVNTGSCSRFEWAVEAARVGGGELELIRPVTSEVFKQKAPRPKHSVLDNFYLRTQGLEVMRPWQIALKDHLVGS